jgi:hypothetical protein
VIVKYVQPVVKMGATVAVDADHQYCWRPEVTLGVSRFAARRLRTLPGLCGAGRPPMPVMSWWPTDWLIMAAGHEGKPMDDGALERWTRVRFER